MMSGAPLLRVQDLHVEFKTRRGQANRAAARA